MALVTKIKNKFSGEYVTFDENGKKVVAPEAKFDRFDKLIILTPICVIVGTMFADVYSLFKRTIEHNVSANEKAIELANSPEVLNKINEIYSSHGLTESQYNTYDYMSDKPIFQLGGEYYGMIPREYYDAKIEITRYAQDLVRQLNDMIGSTPEFAINAMNTLEIGAIVGAVVIALAVYGSYRKDKRLNRNI